MMRLLISIFQLISILALVNCSGPTPPQVAMNLLSRQNVVNISKKSYAAKNPKHITFYSANNQPLTPYRIIGTASVSRNDVFGKMRGNHAITQMMRQLAASIGGDALLNPKEGQGKIKAHVIKYQHILI